MVNNTIIDNMYYTRRWRQINRPKCNITGVIPQCYIRGQCVQKAGHAGFLLMQLTNDRKGDICWSVLEIAPYGHFAEKCQRIHECMIFTRTWNMSQIVVFPHTGHQICWGNRVLSIIMYLLTLGAKYVRVSSQWGTNYVGATQLQKVISLRKLLLSEISNEKFSILINNLKKPRLMIKHNR